MVKNVREGGGNNVTYTARCLPGVGATAGGCTSGRSAQIRAFPTKYAGADQRVGSDTNVL